MEPKFIETFVWSMEAFFLIAMIIKFLTDYREEEGDDVNNPSIRDLKKIAKRYMATIRFKVDFIALVPL